MSVICVIIRLPSLWEGSAQYYARLLRGSLICYSGTIMNKGSARSIVVLLITSVKGAFSMGKTFLAIFNGFIYWVA